MAKRDSVLIPHGHESGWVHKQAEKEAAAKSGEGWKSPAYVLFLLLTFRRLWF